MSVFGNLNAAEILLAIGVLLMAGEVLLNGFILLPMGLAFLLTAVCALIVKSHAVLLVILAVSEIVVFVAFQRARLSRLTRPSVYSNVEGMMGRECLVTEEITPAGGYVKLYGDEWPARSREGGAIPKGARVAIVGLEGNRVFVESIH